MRHFPRGACFSTFTVLAVFLGLILLPCSLVSGKTKTTTPNDKVVIASVDSSAQTVTITIKGTQSTTYTLDSSTVITYDGQPGKFDQLKAGDQVLSYTERDPKSLDNIEVVAGTTPTKTTKKKKNSTT